MSRAWSVPFLLVLLVQAGAARGADASAGGVDGWVALGQSLFAAGADQPAQAKAPPLPFHTIEGVGGCCITPMAYLVNPGPKGTVFGMPAASFTYLNAGRKNVEAAAVTETLFGRVELGYAVNRFGMGSLPDAIKKATGVGIRDDVYLHHFNVRALLLEENSFGMPLPALTAGVHFKYNEGIRDVDDDLSGTLKGIGFKRANGIDYTLTASKTLKLVRPVILSAGLRNSQASQIGYLGFGDSCATTFEGNVVVLPTDWLAVAYEFRQKVNPYDRINNLVGDEDNWHAICAGLILGPHMTLCVGWAHLGNLVNSSGNCAWALQLKYEF